MKSKAVLMTVFLLLAGLASWAREYNLANTGFVPAAAGKVHTEKDRNGNTKVEVKVQHLAKPESLTPPKHAYVVWIKPRGGNPKNVGILRVNENLEGSLTATTPEKVFDVSVTAEDVPDSTTPSGPEALRGTVEQRK